MPQKLFYTAVAGAIIIAASWMLFEAIHGLVVMLVYATY